MLGIIGMIYAAYKFYKLAEQYNKEAGKYSFLSFLLILGIQIGFVLMFILTGIISLDLNETGTVRTFSLVGGLLSFFAAYLWYSNLKTKWEEEEALSTSTTFQDDSVIDDF